LIHNAVQIDQLFKYALDACGAMLSSIDNYISPAQARLRFNNSMRIRRRWRIK